VFGVFVCHKRFRIISSSRAVNVGRSESFGKVPLGNIISAISSSLAVGRLWPIMMQCSSCSLISSRISAAFMSLTRPNCALV